MNLFLTILGVILAYFVVGLVIARAAFVLEPEEWDNSDVAMVAGLWPLALVFYLCLFCKWFVTHPTRKQRATIKANAAAEEIAKLEKELDIT